MIIGERNDHTYLYIRNHTFFLVIIMSDDPSVVLTIMFYAVPNTLKKLLVGQSNGINCNCIQRCRPYRKVLRTRVISCFFHRSRNGSERLNIPLLTSLWRRGSLLSLVVRLPTAPLSRCEGLDLVQIRELLLDLPVKTGQFHLYNWTSD